MNGNAAIYVGASPEAIEAARKAITDILGSQREEKTVRLALTAFQHVAEVKNTSINGGTFTVSGEGTQSTGVLVDR